MVDNGDILRMITHGYRLTSNKHGIVSRVDRPDWRECMALYHAPWDIREGLGWVDRLGRRACDFYRRVLSRDHVKVGPEMGRMFPSSGDCDVDWVEP